MKLQAIIFILIILSMFILFVYLTGLIAKDTKEYLDNGGIKKTIMYIWEGNQDTTITTKDTTSTKEN